MKMKGRVLLAALYVVSISVQATAQTFDPEVQLKKLNHWYAATLKARSAAVRETVIPYGDVVRNVDEEHRNRARTLIGHIPPKTFSPQKSLAAGELYCHAKMYRQKVEAARRFLNTKPPPGRRYMAHQLLLQGYESLSDARQLLSVLRVVQPPSAHEALLLMNQAEGFLTSIVAPRLGAVAALKGIQLIGTFVPLDKLLKDAKEGDLADNVLANVAMAKARLLSKLGRKHEARRTLIGALSRVRVPFDVRMLKEAATKLKIVLPPGKNGI